MKKTIKSTLILCLLYISIFSLNAQPLPPEEPDENPVPISGIEYLIAAGAAFGAKKMYDKRKNRTI